MSRTFFLVAAMAIFFLSGCSDSAFGNTFRDPVVAEDVSYAESSGCSPEDWNKSSMIDVNITVGSQVFAARFYDNEPARAIVSAMPFTLEMDDYARQEKVTRLDITLPAAPAETPATINSGDIYLWSGNSLVLFYTTFSNSYSYVPAGYIVDVTGLTDALGKGSVTAVFQRGEASAEEQVSFPAADMVAVD